MSTPKVVMYSTRTCPYCERARHLLRAKRVSFQEIDVGGHPERRAEMIQRSGRHTVPQIFAGERHLGGCDDVHALDAAGELDALLAVAPSSHS